MTQGHRVFHRDGQAVYSLPHNTFPPQAHPLHGKREAALTPAQPARPPRAPATRGLLPGTRGTDGEAGATQEDGRADGCVHAGTGRAPHDAQNSPHTAPRSGLTLCVLRSLFRLVGLRLSAADVTAHTFTPAGCARRPKGTR